jgi:hypothetical protein
MWIYNSQRLHFFYARRNEFACRVLTQFARFLSGQPFDLWLGIACGSKQAYSVGETNQPN